MAEARNIKVKLTVDVSEYKAALDEIREAIAELPTLTVNAERVTTDTAQERLAFAADAARANGFYEQSRHGYVSVSIVDLETVLYDS